MNIKNHSVKYSAEKLHNKKGFSMGEMLAVLAIMAILFSIAMPSVGKITKDMKMLRFDEAAKEIYMAAQTNLISLDSNGRIEDLKEGCEDNNSSYYADAGVKYITDTDSDLADMLLPLGSIDDSVRLRHFIIEFEPETAIIRSAFFWDDDSISTASVLALSSRTKDERKGFPVGYYDGGSNSRPDPTASPYTLKLSVVNNDELKLVFNSIKDPSFVNGSFRIVLTDVIAKAEGKAGATKEIVVSNGVSGVPTNLTLKADGNYELLLDSLVSGKRFYDLVYDRSNTEVFNPGTNLKIEVIFEQSGYKPLKAETPVFSSLFAWAELSSPYNKSNGNNTAYISCGRHLQNLHVAWSDLDNYDNGSSTEVSDRQNWSRSAALKGISKVVFTNDINWSVSQAAAGSAISLRPIVNSNIDAIDGQGNKLSNIIIGGDGILQASIQNPHSDDEWDMRPVGIFGFFCGSSIKDIDIVDIKISDSSYTNEGGTNFPATHYGTLCGIVFRTSAMSEVRIENIHVYASAAPITENSCYINETKTSNINSDHGKGINRAGGLIGEVRHYNNADRVFVYFANCSASLTKLSGPKQLGGLVGYSHRGYFENCYANVGVRKEISGEIQWKGGMLCTSGQPQGGFIGESNGATGAVDCYAAGYANKDIYGFVGKNAFLQMVRTYSALVTSADGKNAKPVSKFVTSYDRLWSSAILATKTDKSATPQKLSYSDLIKYAPSDGSFVKADEATTKRYGITASDEKVYPFPRLKVKGGSEPMIHYGDWPNESRGVDEIRVYKDEACTQRVYIMVTPASETNGSNGRSTKYYAKPYYQGEPVDSDVSGQFDSNKLLLSIAQNHIANENTATISLQAKKTDTGVTYADLSSEGYTVRVPIIVAKATITLQGKGCRQNDLQNVRANGWGSNSLYNTPVATSVYSSDTPGVSSYTFTNQDDQKVFMRFEPSLSVAPNKNTVKTGLDEINTNLNGAVMIRPVNELKANVDKDWDKLKNDNPGTDPYVSDPYIESNPGGSILWLGNQNYQYLYQPTNTYLTDTIHCTQYADKNEGYLYTASGTDFGTATVSARWAFDESFKASCNLITYGPSANIQKVNIVNNSARYSGGTPADFPETVYLEANAGAAVKLNFVPYYTNHVHGENKTYTWKIERVYPDTALVTTATSYPYPNQPSRPSDYIQGDVTLTIPWDNCNYAKYRVTLIYSHTLSGITRSSTSYMYIEIQR